MSYRNKTYVIFDGDDILSYYLMQAWKANQNIEFNFQDAHETRGIRSESEEVAVKRGLRERFSNASQAIVLVGQSTKNQYRYVRWEIEVAQGLDLPIIVANLDGGKRYNSTTCPPILRNSNAIFVAFSPKIIKHALEHYPDFYEKLDKSEGSNYYYEDATYDEL